MSTDSFIGLSGDEAVKALVPAVTEMAARMKRYSENPLNWLVVRPGWEETVREKWPKNYEGRVGNIVCTYAFSVGF